MKITKIYESYQIMPQLQLHMLRVAGVASLICDNTRKQTDKECILSSLLLHDMGNAVKFDMNYTRKTNPALFDDNTLEKMEGYPKKYYQEIR